jgi:hypothetical protein
MTTCVMLPSFFPGVSFPFDQPRRMSELFSGRDGLSGLHANSCFLLEFVLLCSYRSQVIYVTDLDSVTLRVAVQQSEAQPSPRSHPLVHRLWYPA